MQNADFRNLGSEQQTLVFSDDLGDGGEKVELGELFIGAGVWAIADEAEFVAVLKPIRDLFDNGVFDVGWESGLAGSRCCAGQDVAAGVGDPAN